MTKDTVYFANAHAARENLLGVIAYLREADEAEVEFSRFYMIKDGVWASQLEFNVELKSVAFNSDEPSWWLLGKRGDVFIVSPDGQRKEVIDDAGTGPEKLGYVNKILRVEDESYVCGYRRQVYKRIGQQWAHIDADILCPKSVVGRGFTDMAGTSSSRLIAVGRKGDIFRFDGKRWFQVESGTNVQLSSVCFLSDEVAFACGEKGTVLRIEGNSVQTLEDPEFREQLWAITSFDGDVLAAHAQGIVKITDDGFEPVAIPSNPSTARLTCSGKTLWSVGTRDVFVFDSASWSRSPCPDNE